jgi:hypothetical protein
MNGMIQRLRFAFSHTALGPAVVIWAFGYLLVDIIAFVMGRAPVGVTLLASSPMFVLGVCQSLALNALRKRLRGLSPTPRLSVLIVALLAATAVQAAFDLYWMRWLSLTMFPLWQEWTLDISLQRFVTVATLYLWTFCLVLTMLWAVRMRNTADRSAARAARAEAAAALAQASGEQAEATALRLQLNPHFLFNALNSVSSLVLTDRKDQAEEMIGRLCQFLRASLSADPMEDVPLTQEIESIDAYLAIEEARFGDRLQVEIHVEDGAADALVPNFILQPLVENAVKHGVAAVRGPASLTVAAAREGEELVLTIVNRSQSPGDDASGAAVSRLSTGIGLANTRLRLDHRYDGKGRLEAGSTPGGYSAAIRIPFTCARGAGAEAPEPRRATG